MENFDFSKESKIKKDLFNKIKKEYELAKVIKPLSDDELEFVVAAGSQKQICSENFICELCEEYINGKCRVGLFNKRGNSNV